MGSSVKDKENLLSFNQWSVGEYLNNFNDISRLSADGLLNLVTDKSTIGNSSLEIKRQTYSSEFYGARLRIPIDSSFYGKQAKLSVDIFNPQCNRLSVQYYEEGTSTRSSVSIPINTSFTKQNISIETAINENVTAIDLRVVMQNNTDTSEVSVYVDNPTIIIQ